VDQAEKYSSAIGKFDLTTDIHMPEIGYLAQARLLQLDPNERRNA